MPANATSALGTSGAAWRTGMRVTKKTVKVRTLLPGRPSEHPGLEHTVDHPTQLKSHSQSEDGETLEKRLERLELLYRVGIALSAEHNTDRLIEMILVEAQRLCNADGGTLYLVSEAKELTFAILRTDSLNVALGGTTGRAIDLPPIPLVDAKGKPNERNVASYAAWLKKSVNIEDAYDAEGFDFSGTQEFDQRAGYRSKSFLTIPLATNEGIVIGVIQLINARDDKGKVKSFSPENQRVVEALCSQAAIALYNQLLLDDQKRLLESFIKLIASAIDAKSPYTGAHCERVPILTEMLARSVCDAQTGPFADFNLNDEEWYELHIAAWLHDCGKITTPVHVMDKSTKLETIADRIEAVRARFEIAKRDLQIKALERRLAGDDPEIVDRELSSGLAELDEQLAFVEKSNIGGEFLAPENQQRIAEIGARPIVVAGQPQTLLSEDEVANLSISRGTLLPKERRIINGHMVHTIKMLESLPFPRNLKRVPEYAGGHHEKMDGTGYPKGIFAGDMSIPARIMAIADVFEALTADDRPYKKAKRLSETMRIMGFMKRDNHLDPQLFDHFVRSGVYLEYAKRFLHPDLIDEVDVEELLAIQPKPFELPDDTSRKQRWQGFLSEYDDLG